jgi:hypothetical protein
MKDKPVYSFTRRAWLKTSAAAASGFAAAGANSAADASKTEDHRTIETRSANP